MINFHSKRHLGYIYIKEKLPYFVNSLRAIALSHHKFTYTIRILRSHVTNDNLPRCIQIKNLARELVMS